MWFRRDLRLLDNPALVSAAAEGDVLPLLVLDPRQLAAAGAGPLAYFLGSVAALNASLDGRLHVRLGDPAEVVPAVAREVAATSVHATADFGAFGVARDEAVAAALGDVPLTFTGSPYAVAPGRVIKGDGTPYRVYTPFSKAWLAHGWRRPAPAAAARFIDLPGEALPEPPAGAPPMHPGEAAALAQWEWFKANAIVEYGPMRDRPDVRGTSMLSTALRFGEIHPRTLLADLGEEPGHVKYRNEVAWREFCADLLWHSPHATTRALQPRFDAMRWDSGPVPDAHFERWANGRTGYPMVDAGMRELRATGIMHNRVRMIVASFLVKHLHIEWQRGERLFLELLLDGDRASNALNWQWVAGTGADASPFIRVFNPVGQGLKFDPNGDYVRRWIPELAHLPGATAHEPWAAPNGYSGGYAGRVIDLAEERAEALRRFDEIRA